MSRGSPAPLFGPTTSVVDAFLDQLRHAPSFPPHVTLPTACRLSPACQERLTAVATPPHRHAAVQAAQASATTIIDGLTWPADTREVQEYVEQAAPQVVAVLVLRGYVGPDELADEYAQVYVAGWQEVFGAL
jgi:hypothetical protein